MNLKTPDKYIISGSKHFIDKKSNEICGKYSDPETNHYFGDEFSSEKFFSFIFTPSIFFDSKLAIISNSEKIKDISMIIEESIRSIETSIIFLVQDFDIKKFKLPKDIKINIISEGKVSKYDAIKEIQAMFGKKGFKINNTSADEIYEMCFKDINIIKNELEKIDIYFYGQDKPDSDTKILEIISFSRNDSIFSFIDFFAARKKRECLKSLQNIINSGENSNILFHMLSKRIQQIFLYQISSSLVKGHPFVVDKVKKNTAIWSKKEVYNLIAQLADIDFGVKTGRADITQSLFNLISLL